MIKEIRDYTLGTWVLIIAGILIISRGLSTLDKRIVNNNAFVQTVVDSVETDTIQPTTTIYKVSATCYFPASSQTDNSPYITADNSKINKKHPLKHRWIAISRDLFNQGLNYGDTVIISNTWVYDGKWIIHDTMNKRFFNKIDFLVGSGDFVDMFEDVEVVKTKYSLQKLYILKNK